MESEDTRRRRVRRYKRRKSPVERCHALSRRGLKYINRAWTPREDCQYGTEWTREVYHKNLGTWVHCPHGSPVRCCMCGKFEEPLMEAMRVASQG